MRSVGNRLGIVDHRRTTVQAHNSREGWLDARYATLAFERLHQRRLFAYFIGTGARLRNDVEVHAGPKDILAQKTFGIRIGNSLLDDLQQIPILATQINKPELRSDRQSGNHSALNHRMRVFEEDHM